MLSLMTTLVLSFFTIFPGVGVGFRGTVTAIELDPTDSAQVRNAAQQVASKLVAMYADTSSGQQHATANILGGVPGELPHPYYWWEAGAMFGTLIEYWYYTGDATYNELVRDGILHQIGEFEDFKPANHSKDEGNDDQLFWAFTVMSAAELGFPDPPAPYPGWLALAQSVMNQLISRWDTTLCGGGLRWQMYPWLNGINYKNTAANGGMFQLGARLARYTGNETYAEWAVKAYEWMAGGPLMAAEGEEDEGKVMDGVEAVDGCKKVTKIQWTYNYGIMIGGAAYMYNHTSSPVWARRLNAFLHHTAFFFPDTRNGTMSEICEPSQKCNEDQWSFKAYLSRWLAVAAQLAPHTSPFVLPALQHSAAAAARQCDCDAETSTTHNGAPVASHAGGVLCGSRWYVDSCDGNTGVGQQMSALSVIQSCLIDRAERGPLTSGHGGTSVGNPAAGTGGNNEPALPKWDRVDAGDMFGAALLTALVVGAWVGGGWWIVKNDGWGAGSQG